MFIKYMLKLFILFPFLLIGHTLNHIATWQHNLELNGPCYYSMLDSRNNLILVMFKIGGVLINQQICDIFLTQGQGPNQVMDMKGMCIYHDNLAVFERSNKVKIFSLENGKYRENNVQWLKGEFFDFLMKDAFYFNQIFYLAGYDTSSDKNAENNISFLNLISENEGFTQKKVISASFNKENRLYEIRNKMMENNGKIFFLRENALELYVLEKNNTVKKIILKKPTFYKTMPDDFYVFKQYSDNSNQYMIDLETWSTSYSAITNAVVLPDDLLMVQVRTCNKTSKKFSFLIYDIKKGFDLKDTIFTDDLLLASKNNILYCFANGQPLIDNDSGDLVINIYHFVNH